MQQLVGYAQQRYTLYGLREIPQGWPPTRKGPGLQVCSDLSACTMWSACEESFLVSLVDGLRKVAMN